MSKGTSTPWAGVPVGRDQAFDLLAVPSAAGDGSLLLLGHTHGLLRFTATFPVQSEWAFANPSRQ